MKKYVIGDLHGNLKLLARAYERIRDYSGEKKPHLIFLGDYVDRGPQSKGVLDFLMTVENAIKLRGNHEQMLLDAIEDQPFSLAYKIAWGRSAIATFNSFGVKPGKSLREQIPERYVEFLRSLPLFYEDRHRFYVHAGVAPNRPLHQQDENDLLWIRNPFLECAFHFEKHVVHGHSPQSNGKPELLPNRTNLDSGAFFSGRLTVGVFDDDVPDGPIDVLTVS